MQGQLSELQSMVEALCRRTRQSNQPDLPESLFRLYTDLIDAEVGEDLARELVESMRHSATAGDDPMLLKAHIARTIEDQIQVAGPLSLTPGRASGGAGRSDRRGQDDHHRQVGGQLPVA